ncbi:hypothetical protein BC827DRAFT_1188409 [Russula dissimulans]|nr:hypothetical protein BC827DRAFT_1188409 [Russula dissimulans]
MMDLRAASRNSNLFVPPLPLPLPLPLWWPRSHRAITVFAKRRTSFDALARREDTSFIHGLRGIPFAQFLRFPNKRPTGFCSPQGRLTSKLRQPVKMVEMAHEHARTQSDTTVADAWKRSRGDVKDAMLFGALGYARVVRINRCSAEVQGQGEERALSAVMTTFATAVT